MRQNKSKNLHPRNRHRDGYDFEALCAEMPELSAYVIQSPAGLPTVDFKEIQSVRILNKALLKTYYGVGFWEIPEGYLCPPVPGRADYIHNIADLLADDNGGEIPTGRNIRVLDIGAGANLIYPLLGNAEYGWQFTAADIDPVALKAAKEIAYFNKLKIKLKHQKKAKNIFRGIVSPSQFYHLTLCNPPFHDSLESAEKGSKRKWKNLGKDVSTGMNFGGQNNELWCPGGELQFITRMIEESVVFAEQCLWFTSLVSKKDNIDPILKMLKEANAAEVKVVDMAQGQKISRFIAWSFIPKDDRRLDGPTDETPDQE